MQARDREGAPGRFEFQMRLEPEAKLLDRCREFLCTGPDGEEDVLEVPVQVGVPDQTLPVLFTLRVQLTQADVLLDKDVIDFGECPTSDAVVVPLAVTNASALPTRIGFQHVPRGVSISPQLGICSLLPGERRELRVAFAPYSTADLHFKLQLTTSANKRYPIACSATGTLPPLAFSASALVFRACAPGDRVSHDLFCSNTAKEPRTFQILVPRASGLRVSPVVAELRPGQTVRVQVDFCPVHGPPDLERMADLRRAGEGPAEASPDAGEAGVGDAAAPADGDARPADGADGAAAADGAAEGAAADGAAADGAAADGAAAEDAKEGGLSAEEARVREALHVESLSSEPGSDEPWSQHDTWQLPVFIQNGPTMYLQVQTTTVAPQIVASLDGQSRVLLPRVAPDGVETLPVLNFGELPVGQDRVVVVKVTNASERGADLAAEPLDPFGAFCVLRSPAFLPGRSAQSVSLAFRPKREAAFKEKLTLCAAGGNRLRFLCVGYGVSPAFAMSGLEVESRPLTPPPPHSSPVLTGHALSLLPY